MALKNRPTAGVMITRAQPFHPAHADMACHLLSNFDLAIILVGSATSPRTTRNPFTYPEREAVIRDSVREAMGGGGGETMTRLRIAPLPDSLYRDDAWLEHAQSTVRALTGGVHAVTIVGHAKDSSTAEYLQMFPQWELRLMETAHPHLDASRIRSAYFSNLSEAWLRDCDGSRAGDLPRDAYVTPAARRFLEEFARSEDYTELRRDTEALPRYASKWGTGPFNTVDACVIQSGHVLLIQRGERPQKGSWMLPGGFLQADESLRSGMLRELEEETGLIGRRPGQLPARVVEGSIQYERTYDAVHRDPRARVITHAFLMHLRGSRKGLPPVTGKDDAADARWFAHADVREEMMGMDHFHIYRDLRGRLRNVDA